MMANVPKLFERPKSELMRIQQRQTESPSLFVMRAFALALDKMDDRELMAFANWMASKSADELRHRANKLDEPKTTQ